MAFFDTNFMLQTPQQDDVDDQNQPPTTSFIPTSCNPQQFHGVASIIGKRLSVSFSDNNNNNNNHEGELSDDDGSQMGEKKKRLSVEQVKALEKNFELGNKLEPERKIQLSRALGLKPRQVAIWFQNRRARWKTKQLERDYQILSKQFEVVRAQNDVLQAQNHKLQAEISGLKNKEPTESINLNKETRDEGSCSNRSDSTSDDLSRNPSMSLFPSASLSRADEGVFQDSSRPKTQGPKTEQAVVKEESLCNMMFCGMDDQPGFWPWLQDQQNFN